MKSMALCVLLLVMTGVATAEGDSNSLQAMVEQQKALRAEIAAGAEGLTPRQVRVIDKAQDEFFAIVAGKQTLDQLGIEEKVRVENALETINAQVVNTSRASSDQQVCWRETMVGSKMAVTRCGTQQEIDEAREGARGYLNRPKICVPPGCGA